MSTFAVVRPPSTGSTQPASVSRLRFMRATTRIATRIASLTVILTLLTSLPSGYWRPTRMTPVMSIVHAPWRMAEMTRALPDFIAGICTSTPPSRLATPMMCRASTTFLRLSMESMLPTPCRGGDCRKLSVDHLEDLVAVLEHIVVVGHHHDGHLRAARLLGEQRDHLVAAGAIQGRRRLVDEQQRRLVDERAGDAHPLALAA